MKKYREVVLIFTLFGFNAGCSSQRFYAIGQASQRNQCLDLPDQAELERCMSGADKSYDQYKRETLESK